MPSLTINVMRTLRLSLVHQAGNWTNVVEVPGTRDRAAKAKMI